MGRVRVIRNRLPGIIRSLPDEVADANTDTADSLLRMIEKNIWFDTGVALRTAKTEGASAHHQEVTVGILRGRGFYVLFLEDGTVKARPRPVVRPAAHLHEPIHTRLIKAAVVRACA